MAERNLVADLSEKELLARITPRLRGVEPLLGPGDDGAIVAAPDGRTVISIDTLVQDQDFRAVWPSGYRHTGFDVGWKCAAQNLSDINAMGAVPTSLTVSLTFPGSTAVAWVEDLADGLTAALAGLGADRCSVVGGDLGRGREIVVTAAVTGDLEGRDPLLRSGARAGDLVAVAGVLGRAAAGLALLDSDLDYLHFNPTMLELAERQRRPLPPLALGPQAAGAGATAMMDISDGLVRDGRRLALASGVALDLDAGVVNAAAEPLQKAAAMLGDDAISWVLGGGEDHGLLATFPSGAAIPAGFTVIGRVLAGEPAVTVGGEVPRVAGWDHFAG